MHALLRYTNFKLMVIVQKLVMSAKALKGKLILTSYVHTESFVWVHFELLSNHFLAFMSLAVHVGFSFVS